MAINTRGGGDIDQMSLDFLSGDINAEQFATTDASPKTDAHIAMWLDGNVVDSGISLSLDMLFDDAGNLVITDTATVINT